jgi:hypothetical protein
MQRILLVAVFVGGCTQVESIAQVEQSEAPEPTTDAERIFVEDVLPILEASCGGCHAEAQLGGEAFLAGETWVEIRQSLLASRVGDLDIEPHNSPLVTKGVHSGPYLTAAQTSAIIEWLEAERAAAP